ncbi:CAP domain-containing protein [Companilactobacillus insicii]|uniref:CAP domain-containing protein n=1 Tax=Companilactobacillus insicii TaxID=1732567 RepID=UPI000F77FDAD|nr:CAP domain-containing protein [Companilactobacillus insicii]
MFSNSKKVALLLATGVLLSTSFGGTTALADTTSTNTGNDTAVSTATNNQNDSENQVVKDTNTTVGNTSTDDSSTTNTNGAKTNGSTAATSATTKVQSVQDIDLSAVRSAMLAELNSLRAQNGLSTLTSVGVLNAYAQTRTDSFTSTGVDDHAGWNSANMYPYYLDAEENIAQMPFTMLGTTDPTVIAQKITAEFYNEYYDPQPNYGHRKNMLNPYINYVGIGVSVGSNGMVYFSQEMGNDAEAHSRYAASDLYSYYLTNENDYANVSQYNLVDSKRKNADYKARDGYAVADVRGGVTTKNAPVSVYDRYGNKTDLVLAANTSWSSDIIAIMDNSFYYHVSNNGFVLADDVTPWASFLAGTVVTATNNAMIYTDSGLATGTRVPAGTMWKTDRRSTNAYTGVKMYRVGTNAWLMKTDLTGA